MEAATTTAETLVSDALGGGDEGAEGGEDENDDENEIVAMSENLSYLTPLLKLITMLHLFVSFSILVAYYQLKVSVLLLSNNLNTLNRRGYHTNRSNIVNYTVFYSGTFGII